MAVRIIVATTDARCAANVGGPVHVSYTTFDVSAPDLEAFMAQKWECVERSIVGVEVIPEPAQ